VKVNSPCQVGPVHHLDAAQPLDSDVARPAGNDEPQRLAVLQTYCLAVLAVCDQDEEEDARRRRQALDLVYGQDHRMIDHAMDQETVRARVDAENAAAVDLSVECGRRDDTQRLVQRWGVANIDLVRAMTAWDSSG
jgi:hypothetical protein